MPRSESNAGTPSEVTFAPSVAPDVVMEVAVGVVTVGETADALGVPVTCCVDAYAV